jgi:hypothetical protein
MSRGAELENKGAESLSIQVLRGDGNCGWLLDYGAAAARSSGLPL